MENRLFINLLKLYSSYRKNTPREDFFTEVLAGVLQSDQQLLNDYAREVLKLPEDQFSLTTQARYLDAVIDMVFESKNHLCFVENKVDALEGERQLPRYTETLKTYSTAKQVHLRYCTYYRDQKTLEDDFPLSLTSFYQFRWLHIYEFFIKHPSNNPMVEAFLVLLKDESMYQLPDFDEKDLMAIPYVVDIIAKMDDCFDSILDKKPLPIPPPDRQGYSARIKEFPEYGRYTLVWQKGIIAGQGESEIVLIFGFAERPFLSVECYCNRSHSAYSNFKRAIENGKKEGKLVNLQIDEDYEDGYFAWFEEPLSNFIKNPSQFEAITNWFIEKMEQWAEFMGQDKTVKWMDLPRKAQPSSDL